MRVIATGLKYNSEVPFIDSYEEDDLKTILAQIAREHSYDQFNPANFEEDETLDDYNSVEMVKFLSNANSDGCDYIVSIMIVEGDVIDLNI